MWSGFNAMAHAGTWQALPRDIKDVIERNVTKYVRQQRQEQAVLNAELRNDFVRRGLVFNEVDQAAFRADFRPSMRPGRKSSAPSAGRWSRPKSAGSDNVRSRARQAGRERIAADRDTSDIQIAKMLNALQVRPAEATGAGSGYKAAGLRPEWPGRAGCSSDLTSAAPARDNGNWLALPGKSRASWRCWRRSGRKARASSSEVDRAAKNSRLSGTATGLRHP